MELLKVHNLSFVLIISSLVINRLISYALQAIDKSLFATSSARSIDSIAVVFEQLSLMIIK